MARFEAWLPIAREFGLETRLLRARDLHTVVPGLGGQWVGGMHTPGDGHADPEKTTDAFARAATAHGASVQLGCAVQQILTHGGAVQGVVTERGEIRAPWVVCAAGAWSWRLARTVGLDLPQRWVRGTVARTTVAPPISACAVWGPGVAFRQRRDGSFTIAAGGALDHDVTLDSLRQVRFFLPNYWKNKSLFRFHVGRPLLRSLRAALPGSPARRQPLVWDRGDRARAESHESAQEPRGAATRAAGAAAPGIAKAGRATSMPRRTWCRSSVRSRSFADSCWRRASAATASRWAPSRGASSPS